MWRGWNTRIKTEAKKITRFQLWADKPFVEWIPDFIDDGLQPRLKSRYDVQHDDKV